MQTARAVQDHCLRCRTIMWKYGEPQVVRPNGTLYNILRQGLP